MGKPVKTKIIKNKQKQKVNVMSLVRTLWSNEAAMQAGIHFKWYWALILFLFSMLLSVVPGTVQTSLTDGGSYVNNAQGDSFQYGLYDYTQNVTAGNEIIFTEDGRLAATVQSSEKFNNYSVENNKTNYYYKPVFTYTRNGESLLDIYVFNDNTVFDYSTCVNNIINSNTAYGYALDGDQADPNVTETLTNIVKEGKTETRTASLIAFFPNRYFSRSISLTGKGVSFEGDYQNLYTPFGDLLKSKQLSFKDVLLKDTAELGGEFSKAGKAFENYRTFVHFSYINNRTKATWITFGIYCGINGGTIILVGLVLFIMSRGKNNPNKVIKWYQCFQMAAWLAPTCAVLSMLGFINSFFAMLAFPMFMVFRSMWFSMKYLRPAPQN